MDRLARRRQRVRACRVARSRLLIDDSLIEAIVDAFRTAVDAHTARIESRWQRRVARERKRIEAGQ